MSEGTSNQSTIGDHSGEFPIVYPITKNGKYKIINGAKMVLDITKIKEIKINEGIAEFCPTGYIVFVDDGITRISTLFRDGFDYLEIEFFSNYSKGYKKIKFEILNIEGIEKGRLIAGYDILTMYIAQYPAYRNLQVWKISKGYKDKKISDIITDVFDTYLNSGKKYESIIESTDPKLESFCNPFWSPYQTINYLKKYASANGQAGFFGYFDMNDKFHFRSLNHILTNGKTHNLVLSDVRNTKFEDAEKESKLNIRDYYANFGQKQYYKIGLSGSSVDRFNWFRKKQFTLKTGYKKRPLPKGPNILYEKPEDINNMFGYYMFSGYRWEEQKPFADALVYNRLLTAVAAQCRTRIVINGIVDLSSGDQVKIKSEVKGENVNIEELEGKWFIREITHSWDKTLTYNQTLHLSRDGDFIHLGE